jgi:hypothetical protein
VGVTSMAAGGILGSSDCSEVKAQHLQAVSWVARHLASFVGEKTLLLWTFKTKKLNWEQIWVRCNWKWLRRASRKKTARGSHKSKMTKLEHCWICEAICAPHKNFAELNMDYNHGLDLPKDWEQAQWQ